MVAMEGKAFAWYQWWEFSTQNPTWEEFHNVLLKRFPNLNDSKPFRNIKSPIKWHSGIILRIILVICRPFEMH